MNKRFKINVSVATIITLLILIISSTFSCKHDNEKVIVAILPMTGPSSDLGQSVANGMRLAEHDINQSSGSTKFKLVIEDSKGQPKEALTTYQALLARNKPSVVLSWMSSAAKALAPVAQNDNVALFIGAALPGLTNDTGMIIRVWPKAEALAELTGQFAVQKGFKKIAILYINDDYGQSVAQVFSDVVTKGGAEIVAKEPLEIGATDFRVIIEKIKTTNPEAIFIPAYGVTYVQGLKQIREILGNSVTVMADLTVLSSFTMPQLGNELEGVVVPATNLDIEPYQLEETARFAQAYQSRFQRKADFNSGLGYMMFLIAAKGQIASDGTAKGVADYIAKTKTFDGPLGTITYNNQNDCTIPLRIVQIKNARPQPLQ